MSLFLQPITLRAAREYVGLHHRHHKPPQGGLFAVSCADEEGLRGVAIIGMPVARMLADGFTAEVARLCTDGTRNERGTNSPTFFREMGELRTEKDGRRMPIDEAVRWALTGRGGRQYELFAPEHEEGCVRWGLCDAGGGEKR